MTDDTSFPPFRTLFSITSSPKTKVCPIASAITKTARGAASKRKCPSCDETSREERGGFPELTCMDSLRRQDNICMTILKTDLKSVQNWVRFAKSHLQIERADLPGIRFFAPQLHQTQPTFKKFKKRPFASLATRSCRGNGVASTQDSSRINLFSCTNLYNTHPTYIAISNKTQSLIGNWLRFAKSHFAKQAVR